MPQLQKASPGGVFDSCSVFWAGLAGSYAGPPYPHPRCWLGMEKASVSSQMHPVPSKSECAKGTIHPNLALDTCPWVPSESPYGIPARWALGTQPGHASARRSRVSGRDHSPHVPGSGPAPRAFVRSSPLSLARLQSPRPRGPITAGCSRGRSPSCHRSHRQRLSMGPAHIPDATYTREGEWDKGALKSRGSAPFPHADS